MYLENKIKGILEEELPAFQQDDLSFELIKVEDGVTEVKLIIGPMACSECIVSEQILEKILLEKIRKDLPIIREVKVHKMTKGSD